MSKINLGDEAEADIRNAVNAGKIATSHENRINFNGWIGEGYTLIDPQTGAGAYVISGGGNGGELPLGNYALQIGLGLAVFATFLLPFGLVLAHLVGPLIALAIGVILIWSLVLVEIQTLEPGAIRDITANLAYGALGFALGALTGSLWASFLIGWIGLSIANYHFSSIQVANSRSSYLA